VGHFKNEVREKYHFIPIAWTTQSGLQVRLWIGRLLDEYKAMGIMRGPMFHTSTGQPIKAGSMGEDFFSRLKKV
jgi:hypothetical protein